jgi:hypothetical protein
MGIRALRGVLLVGKVRRGGEAIRWFRSVIHFGFGRRRIRMRKAHWDQLSRASTCLLGLVGELLMGRLGSRLLVEGLVSYRLFILELALW